MGVEGPRECCPSFGSEVGRHLGDPRPGAARESLPRLVVQALGQTLWAPYPRVSAGRLRSAEISGTRTHVARPDFAGCLAEPATTVQTSPMPSSLFHTTP